MMAMRPPGSVRTPDRGSPETLRLIAATSNDGLGACACTVSATAAAAIALLRKFLADIDVGAPVLNALRARHRALADDFDLHEVEDALHLAHLQRRRRIGHREALALEIRRLHVVAAAVRVREAIVRGHALAGPAAFDGHQHQLAGQARLTQIRAA